MLFCCDTCLQACPAVLLVTCSFAFVLGSLLACCRFATCFCCYVYNNCCIYLLLCCRSVVWQLWAAVLACLGRLFGCFAAFIHALLYFAYAALFFVLGSLLFSFVLQFDLAFVMLANFSFSLFSEPRRATFL